MKDFYELIKALVVLLILSVPPWIEFYRLYKERIKKPLFFLFFILYAVLVYFFRNFTPFILVIIILNYSRYREDEAYYFRPLSNKLGIVISSVGFKIGITFINYIFVIILMLLGIKYTEQDIIKIIDESTGFMFFIVTALTVIVAPVLEEYIFRHIFYRKMSQRIGRNLSAIISSILFTIPHFNLAGSVSFFGVGMFNCYLYDKYGYRASVLNHFIFNLIGVLIIVIVRVFHIPLK